MFAPIGSSADVRKNAHERLGELLCELKSVLLRYPTINTIDILTMAALLITKIKSRSLCIHVGVSTLLSAKYEWTLDKISASLRCHLRYSLSGMAILFKILLNSTVDICYTIKIVAFVRPTNISEIIGGRIVAFTQYLRIVCTTNNSN